MPQPFSLQCFPGNQQGPPLRISGSLARRGAQLLVSYQLQGDLDQLDIPAPRAPAGRRDNLWRRTCFELFIAAPGEPGYWEYNLSPSGDWNCYRFKGYREQMAVETAVSAALIELRTTNSGLWLGATLPLPPALLPPPAAPTHRPPEVAISAVIQQRDGGLSHWALTHPARQADFHHRDGFVLALSGVD